MQRSYVLSIAGLDPSGGAGLLADIKTFEQLQVYGLGVCTALTVQNEDTFLKLQWTRPQLILEQIDILFEKYTINYCKIGIVENWSILNQITQHLHLKNSNIQIVVDPVLRATAGFNFHKTAALSELEQWLKQIHLLTPNQPELEILTGQKNMAEAAKTLARYTNILAKGGHSTSQKGVDFLYTSNGSINTLLPSKNAACSEKHGSGCVLSSAIAAQLAKGDSLEVACKNAKAYITQFLSSTSGLLGYHS
ncbi:MAG: hydroxymethylpyrimidine/phosphomethylpyrimidine kinase [Aureispira sp.]|nr:hydroxymethylpyrimidine/phosphomethylpyrimidine kinase [Aureispira sp.]